MSDKSMPDLIKVNYSHKEPELEKIDISSTSSPYTPTVDYEALIEVTSTKRTIEAIHTRLRPHLKGNEWFYCTLEAALAEIHEEISQRGKIILANYPNKSSRLNANKKRGWVYVMSHPARPGLVKVGYTMTDPQSRAQELNDKGSPFPPVVDYETLVFSPYEIEQNTHKRLTHQHEGKEWFRCSTKEAINAIKQETTSNLIIEIFTYEDRIKEEKKKQEKEINDQLSAASNQVKILNTALANAKNPCHPPFEYDFFTNFVGFFLLTFFISALFFNARGGTDHIVSVILFSCLATAFHREHKNNNYNPRANDHQKIKDIEDQLKAAHEDKKTAENKLTIFQGGIGTADNKKPSTVFQQAHKKDDFIPPTHNHQKIKDTEDQIKAALTAKKTAENKLKVSQDGLGTAGSKEPSIAPFEKGLKKVHFTQENNMFSNNANTKKPRIWIFNPTTATLKNLETLIVYENCKYDDFDNTISGQSKENRFCRVNTSEILSMN